MSKGLGKSFVISIHAPTWGATQPFRISAKLYLYFNPRTHVGCDDSGGRVGSTNRDFNPRTHVGCDTAFGIG